MHCELPTLFHEAKMIWSNHIYNMNDILCEPNHKAHEKNSERINMDKTHTLSRITHLPYACQLLFIYLLNLSMLGQTSNPYQTCKHSQSKSNNMHSTKQ